MEPNHPYPGPPGDPALERGVELHVGEARRLPVAHGWYWVRDAWRITSANKGLWALAFFVLMMVLMGIGLVSMLIPLVGNLAVTVVTPVFMVGLFHLAHRRAEGGEFEFGELFIGFSRKTGPLIYAGLSQAVLQIIYMIVIFVLALGLFGSDIAHFFMQGFAADANALNPAMVPDFGPALVIKGLLFTLVLLLVMVPYLAALWLQIPLVYFGDLSAPRALQESFKTSFSNWLPLLWYGVVLMLLSLGVMLTFGVVIAVIQWVFGSGLISGLLFTLLALAGMVVGLMLLATYFVSVYTAFRDIFAGGQEAYGTSE